MVFALPSRGRTTDGAPRHVGFELEFAGVAPEPAARIVADVVGGRPIEIAPFTFEVRDGRHGTWAVELDARTLRDRGYLKFLEPFGVERHDVEVPDRLEKWLGRVAGLVVPCEVTSPPIPFDDLALIDDVREGLRLDDALGTGESLTFGFGLHLNVESPQLDVATTLAYLRAFLLLSSWIRRESRVDLTRRVAPYVRDFPSAYRRRVLDPDYAPTTEVLIDDYLEHSATRNRPLDLLPLLATLDEPRVRSGAREPELLKARPAFHFRLPNCRVDERAWRVEHEWARWLEIERLAADDARRAEMGREALEYDEAAFLGDGGWLDRVDAWLA